MKKLCKNCKEEKNLEEFYKRKKGSKDGHRGICKQCWGEQSRSYLKNNRERVRELERERYKKDNYKKTKKAWRVKNHEKIKEYNKRNRNEEYHKQWREDNKKSIAKNRRKRERKRLKEDIVFRLRSCIRKNLWYNLNNKKPNTSEEILGCTVEFFKDHIESQFEPWMTWDNHGKYNGEYNHGWDLDHIIPISLANTDYQVESLSHWINYQPLCSRINRVEKRDKF